MKTNENGNFLEKIFKLKANGTNVKTEILAGITTFITMAYIIFVNPSILMQAGMNTQGLFGDAAAKAGISVATDPIVGSVFVATCLAAAVATLIMAFYANLPFAQASGMGLNAFFTYSVCLGLGYTWRQALAAVFISGILFIIITLTSIREKIVHALPKNLKFAISGGIGLFIALIGLKNGGVIVANQATLVGFGKFADKGVILTLSGLLITAILMARKVKGSILIGILVTTIIGIPMGLTNTDINNIVAPIPSVMPTLFQFDFGGLLSHTGSGAYGAITGIIMVVLTFSLVDLFDTIGTLVGTAQKGGLVDKKGHVKNMNKALISDAVGTTVGACLGTSTICTYVESSAGISEGGKTGLTSATVGVLFLLSLFFAPVVGMVPSQATAPALIIVGVLMMESITRIDFSDFTEALPAFFTMAMMPFTYSIANGIATGLIAYPIVKIVTGRRKEVHPIIYILAVLFLIRFIVLPE